MPALSSTAFSLEDGDHLVDVRGNRYLVTGNGTLAEQEGGSIQIPVIDLERQVGILQRVISEWGDNEPELPDTRGLDPRVISFMKATRKDLSELKQQVDDLSHRTPPGKPPALAVGRKGWLYVVLVSDMLVDETTL